MSFTVNFHTDENTRAVVVDLDGADTPDLLAVRIGSSGEHVTILGRLNDVQSAIDDAAAQLASLSKARAEREFEREQPREHAVACRRCHTATTWNRTAVCDGCAESEAFGHEAVSA